MTNRKPTKQQARGMREKSGIDADPRMSNDRQPVSGFSGGRVGANSLPGDRLLSGAIGARELGSGAINNGHVARRTRAGDAMRENAIGSFELALWPNDLGGNDPNRAVGTFHLRDGAVTSRVLGPLSVYRGAIRDGAVDFMQLADNAIGQSKLNDNSVTSRVLDTRTGSAAVSPNAIQNDAVSRRTIQAGAVAPAQIDMPALYGLLDDRYSRRKHSH